MYLKIKKVYFYKSTIKRGFCDYGNKIGNTKTLEIPEKRGK